MHFKAFLFRMGLAALAIIPLFLVSCASSNVKVDSPAGHAAVFVNDSAVGLTPWNGRIPLGSTRISVEKNGQVLHDTSFLANNHGQILWHSLVLGGGTLGLGGYLVFNSMPLLLLGASAEMGGILMSSYLLTDHKIELSGQAPPHGFALYGTGRQTLRKLLQDTLGRADTLFRTDSLCYESKRQTVWAYDHAQAAHRPFALKALGRCLPNSETRWVNDPVWPYLGYNSAAMGLLGAFMGAIAPEMPGNNSSRFEQIQILTLVGAGAGVLYGFYFWTHSPKHEVCTPMQDPDEFLQWLRQYPCEGAGLPVPATPPTNDATPAGELRVIQFPLANPS